MFALISLNKYKLDLHNVNIINDNIYFENYVL